MLFANFFTFYLSYFKIRTNYFFLWPICFSIETIQWLMVWMYCRRKFLSFTLPNYYSSFLNKSNCSYFNISFLFNPIELITLFLVGGFGFKMFTSAAFSIGIGSYWIPFRRLTDAWSHQLLEFVKWFFKNLFKIFIKHLQCNWCLIYPSIKLRVKQHY